MAQFYAEEKLRSNNMQNNPTHQDFVFLRLSDGLIRLLPHKSYTALVQKRTKLPEYAGQKLRVAILYVALKDNAPVRVVNEAYSFLFFDKKGYADPHHGRFPIEDNNRFYDAALNSAYSNIDYDPHVREVRQTIGDEFSWLPTDDERIKMHDLIF